MTRSLYAKVLLWFIATMLACLVMVVATSWTLSRAVRRDDPFARGLAMQADMLRRSYENGGAPELQKALRQMNEFFPGPRYFVDRQGKDLATGEDRSEVARQAHRPGPRPFIPSQGQAIAFDTPDGKYRYLVFPRGRPSPWDSLPYYLWILFAVAVITYVFTRYLIAPLRLLRTTLERFGRGELEVRARSQRRDEFGQVSAAFDEMAERIETLLTAERRLLQDISHELRTPLSRMGFAIELARQAPDRDAALNRIKKEADRLGALVEQLLQVTRAEGDPAAREFSEVPIDELLKSVAEDTAWEAEMRHVKIVSRVDAAATVRGDRELLRRAVENIVRNALRYAPEGSSVEIGLERAPGSARIHVRDHGPGVAEANLDRIFQPFFREDSSRTAATGGIGLGLAIAYRAISLHHGRVEAKNLHPGLMVSIELPAPA